MAKKNLYALQRNFSRFAQEIRYFVGRDVAIALFERIVMAWDFPVDSGKLISSGYLYYEGRLIKRSKDLVAGIARVDRPFKRPPRKAHTITVIFTARRPVGPNARVYFMHGGRRQFDYAYIVHEGGAKTRPQPYVSKHMRSAIVAELLRRRTQEAWSKTM